MKNEKAENQKMEDVYNKEYLPSIVRVCIIGKHIIFLCSIFIYLDWMGGHAGLAGYRKGHFCLAAD